MTKALIDCSTLPGHLRAICDGTHRDAGGNPYAMSHRLHVVSKRLKVEPDTIRLPASLTTSEPIPAWSSGIGDRLHKIILRETGAAVPCSECKRAIDELNRLTPDDVTAKQNELADDIVQRAKTKAPQWWQRWGVRLAPSIAKTKVLAWIDEACEMPEVDSVAPPIMVPVDDEIDGVTVVVKSFKRHLSLWRLVQSIRHFYPEMPIVICDDSFADQTKWTDALLEVSQTPGVTVVRLPYDSGISAGRNAAVAAARTSRIILCDDDFVFTEETKIEHLTTILDAGGYDIVGGVVRMDGKRPENWTGHLSLTGTGNAKTVGLVPLRNPEFEIEGLHCQDTDITLNFFAAKRSALLKTPWDNRYKITEEHLDSFMSWTLAAKLRIAWTKACVIGHWQTAPLDYKKMRGRRDGFSKLDAKWGVATRQLIKRHQVEGLPMNNTVSQYLASVGLPEKPPIVVLGVGRCGTTILTRMLMKLGWKCPLADQEFAEHADLRAINDAVITTGQWDDYRARQLVNTLPPPWIIKDPRLAITLDKWKPMLPDDPMLVWISRDLDDVRESLKAKGWGRPVGEEVMLRGRSIADLEALCQKHYDGWQGPKLHIQYEQLHAAMSLFDTTRGSHSVASETSPSLNK